VGREVAAEEGDDEYERDETDAQSS
jgi:hypothetical protein